MKQGLVKEAGTALFWKAAQHGGDNLIYLLRMIILARILTPDDFGLLAIALTGFVPLLIITDFGMLPALVQRRETTDRDYDTAWTIGILRAGTIGLIVFFGAPFIAAMFAETRAVSIIRVLAVLPILEAAASIKVAELIRNLSFRSLAIVKLAQALTNTVVSVALAPSMGVWALVVGTLAGPAAYVVVSYMLAPHHPRLAIDWFAARSLASYGQWILATGLFSISGAVVLRVAISRQLGVAELGLYSLAAKLAFLPHEMAGEIAGGVTFPVYARLQSNIREATKAFRAIFTAMVFVLIPVFSLMFFLAPSLVNNLLGPRWEGTIPLIRVLAAAGLVRVFADATIPVLKGLGQPYKFAMLEGIQTILLAAFVWGFIHSFGLVGAGYAWLPAVGGTLAGSFVFLRQCLENPFKGLAKSLSTIFVASVTAGIVALAIDRSWPGMSGFTLALVIATGIIGWTLWVSQRAFLLEFKNYFERSFPKAAALLPGFER